MQTVAIKVSENDGKQKEEGVKRGRREAAMWPSGE